MSNPNTAVATTPNKRTVRDLVMTDNQQKEIQRALPKHLTAERMTRVFLTTISDPKFAKCTPESLLAAMLKCSQIGLEPDGRLLALVPFGDKVTIIPMYQGFADLCWRSGIVEDIKANLVYENDEFDYEEGTQGFLRHKPLLKGDRGKIYATYSLVKVNGKSNYYVMRIDDVLRIRDMSASYRMAKQYGKETIWEGPNEGEMIKKTVFRRHCKLLPLTAEIRERMDHDEDAKVIDGGGDPIRNAKPILAEVADVAPKEPEPVPDPQDDKHPDDGDRGPAKETKSHTALRHLMKAGNITEATFLTKMREGGLIDDSIDQIGLLSQKQCDAIAKDWTTLVEKLK